MAYQIDRADYCSEAGAQRNAASLAVTGIRTAIGMCAQCYPRSSAPEETTTRTQQRG
jgi:hypothetical protein